MARVLVADDDPMVRMLMKEALTQADFSVDAVADGIEALAKFQEVRPDLVILDVGMPNLNGFDTCRQLKSMPGGDKTPVMMVTGLDDVESINMAYDSGATDFTTKPVNFIILKERVRYIIRARRAFQNQLETEGRHRALLDAMPDSMFRISSDGLILDCKSSSNSHPKRFIGKGINEVLPVELGQTDGCPIRRAFETRKPQSFEFAQSRNGKKRFFEARMVASGEEEAVVILRDVTDRNKAVLELKWERDFVTAVLDTATALVIVQDRKGRIVEFNRACEKATGYSAEEVYQKHAWELLVPSTETKWEEQRFNDAVAEVVKNAYENRWVTKDGQIRTIKWTNSHLLDPAGQVEHVISTGVDVTEQMHAEEQIRYLAYYDTVTGLPNRHLFKEHLARAIAIADRAQEKLAVLFIDLNRFKAINETFGHTQGDHVLKTMANRLQDCLRRGDIIARHGPDTVSSSIGRFGGDEFAVFISKVPKPGIAGKIAQRLLNAVVDPVELNGRDVVVNASIGISLFPSNGRDAETLLRLADVAMHESKKAYQGGFTFHDPAMSVAVESKLVLENELRRALEKSRFILYYQPKVRLSDPKVVGLEALIRLRHDDGSLILPGNFIPLAEETGLMLPLGEWIIQEACRQSAAWKKSGLRTVPIAVNISSLQFRQPNLVEILRSALKANGLKGDALELEITESATMLDELRAVQTMQDLKKLGTRLAIDDFGTGYSSLGYLKKFPVHAVKIDRGFLSGIETCEEDRAITSAIVALAHKLNLEVVAEGVETLNQFRFLEQLSCNQVQGFLFSKAVPASQIPALLAEPRIEFIKERAIA